MLSAINCYEQYSGWTCGSCGAYVGWNEGHVCPSNFFYPQYSPTVTVSGDYPMKDNELHDKLDEILKLLRRLT